MTVGSPDKGKTYGNALCSAVVAGGILVLMEGPSPKGAWTIGAAAIVAVLAAAAIRDILMGGRTNLSSWALTASTAYALAMAAKAFTSEAASQILLVAACVMAGWSVIDGIERLIFIELIRRHGVVESARRTIDRIVSGPMCYWEQRILHRIRAAAGRSREHDRYAELLEEMGQHAIQRSGMAT